MFTHLENLNKQIRISDVISVLVAQSTQLIEIVNKNQKEINRLKKEQEQLQVHTDNATDQMDIEIDRQAIISERELNRD